MIVYFSIILRFCFDVIFANSSTADRIERKVSSVVMLNYTMLTQSLALTILCEKEDEEVISRHKSVTGVKTHFNWNIGKVQTVQIMQGHCCDL